MKNIISFNTFKLNESEIKPLKWSEYCQDVFDATAAEVEKAISKDFDKDEIAGFKKSTYYVLGGVSSPDHNKGIVKMMLKDAQNQVKKLGDNVIMLDSEDFFDKAGSLRRNAVACEGDGLAPYSIDFD